MSLSGRLQSKAGFGRAGSGSGGAGRSSGFSSGVKNAFFDRPAVIAEIGKRAAASLSRTGALVMTIARRSIRRIKKHSVAPGPPHTQTGFLKEDIVFSYDPQTKSVVIGPYRCPWLNILMEKGGDVPMEVCYYKLNRILMKPGRRGNSRIVHTGQMITAHYAPRPFMSRALRVGKERYAQAFAPGAVATTFG